MRAVETETVAPSGGDFRLDRLATLYVFHPLRQHLSVPSPQRIPILMYHSVSVSTQAPMAAYYDVYTTPAAFAGQMHYLRDHGFEAMGIEQVIAQLESGKDSGRKGVAITFDDGYRDFYTHAFPVLAECSFTATVYLPTAYIGHSPAQFKGMDCLTWEEVRELQRMGIEFGSHTVTHPKLVSCNPAELESELRDSKLTIEDELGIPIPSFSYPYAFPETSSDFKFRLRALLEECGYRNGVSTILGTMQNLDDRYFLKRLPVSSGDDVALFRAKLEGGYDWLHSVQLLAKLAKSGGH